MLKTCVDRRFARFGLRETRLEHEAKEKTAKARPPGALAERSLRSILQLSPVGSEERKESNAAVVGFGAVCLDYLACVSEYPKPDDKIRSDSFTTQGGGNAGNSMTCVARLASTARASRDANEVVCDTKEEEKVHTDKCVVRLVSKVGADSIGQSILEELRAEGIDCSSVKVGCRESTSAFTYIIVDSKTETRTCIHTPLQQPMVAEEVVHEMDKLLEGAQLVYFDGRHTDVALHLARVAKNKNIPILVDAEKPRPYLDELLQSADIVVTSENFFQSENGSSSSEASGSGRNMLSSILHLAQKTLVNAKLIIVTRGSIGSIAFANPKGGLVKDITNHEIGPEVERQIHDNDCIEKEKLVDDLGGPSYQGVKKPIVREVGETVLISSSALIPDVIDTTGAGDAYIGALIYGFLRGQDASIANIITFASIVAGLKCRQVGARAGLPYGKDLPFLNELLPGAAHTA